MPSGHQRAKNIGYDEDDVYSDDYYEEEEQEGDGTIDYLISVVLS